MEYLYVNYSSWPSINQEAVKNSLFIHFPQVREGIFQQALYK